jgi:hypothetical protein
MERAVYLVPVYGSTGHQSLGRPVGPYLEDDVFGINGSANLLRALHPEISDLYRVVARSIDGAKGLAARELEREAAKKATS